MVTKVLPRSRSDCALSMIDLGSASWELIRVAIKRDSHVLTEKIGQGGPRHVCYILVDLRLGPEFAKLL